MNRRGPRYNRWQKARRIFVKNNPEAICAIRYFGCYYYADTVDHIIKRSQRPDLIDDQSNLQWACGWCHDIKDNKGGRVDKVG